MPDSHYVRGVGHVRVGTKVEVWGEDAPEDWGEVTAVHDARVVSIHWYMDGATAQFDVLALGPEIVVPDWSDEVYARIDRDNELEGRGGGAA